MSRKSQIKKQKRYNLLQMPEQLYKYYSYDNKLNSKRFSGEIYLSTPYEFNDPCDCRRGVKNNLDKLKIDNKKKWIREKLHELDFKDAEIKEMADDLLTGSDNFATKVFERQLEKLGVFCSTVTYTDSQMWGYYANNDGYCIEYDVTQIQSRIIIGFINKMTYELTRHLFKTKRYCIEPNERCDKEKSEYVNNAIKIFSPSTVDDITNTYLREINKKNEILNFIMNIYVKRFVGKSIGYYVNPQENLPPLFYDKDADESKDKYFRKTKAWEHEGEFRFIVSLGGGKVIQLGPQIIKNIYLGCNMQEERIVELLYLINKHKLSCGVYKMSKLKNCGLRARRLDIRQFCKVYESLASIFKENQY